MKFRIPVSLFLSVLFITIAMAKEPGKIPDFKKMLGKKITLSGAAVDRKGGAYLIGDGFAIWIDGLDSWPKGFYFGGDKGVQVRVTGTVIEKFDLPVFVPENEGEVKQGIPVEKGVDLREASHRFLIKNVKWKIVK